MSPGQANQLTSYLYGLKTPEAVQAYAAQHQNDINVVGIASGVANAMKRAQQQMTPQQPQPSVTQQAIAQMAPRGQMPQQAPQMAPQGQPMQQAPQAQLPENTGIGQLPVPSMQSMAGGGITGEPMKFSGKDQNLVPSAPYGQAIEDRAAVMGLPAAAADLLMLPARAGANMWGALGSGALNGLGRVENMIAGRTVAPTNVNLSPNLDLGGFYNASQEPVQALNYGNEAGRADLGGISNPTPTTYGGLTPNQYGPAAQDIPGYHRTDPRTNALGLTPVSNPAYERAMAERAVAQRGAAESMSGLNGLLSNTGGTDAFTRNLQAIQARQSQDPTVQQLHTAQDFSDQMKELAKANGIDPENTKGFAELDKMDKRSQDLLEKKSAMSIIQAGLGMIRSGNPFEAIAAGAGQGLKSYGEAVDQAQATQQKLMESRLSMEAAVNAMKMGNVKDAVNLAQNAKKMDQELFMANNRDAVSLTNNDKSVAAQIYDAKLRAQTGAASNATQNGLLALAALRNPAEIAKMQADTEWLKARAAAAPAKIDAATHAKAVQAADAVAMKSMYAYDPNSAGFKKIWQEAYDRAAIATPSAGSSATTRTIDFNTGKPIQ